MSSVFFWLYPCLYTGTMPTQLLPHVYAEWKGCLRGSFPRLGAYASASAGFLVGWSCTWLMMEHLPTRLCLRNKNLHCFRACLRMPTRTVKYHVVSLRGFIRSSLEYIMLVIQKKTIFVYLTHIFTPHQSSANMVYSMFLVTCECVQCNITYIIITKYEYIALRILFSLHKWMSSHLL